MISASITLYDEPVKVTTQSNLYGKYNRFNTKDATDIEIKDAIASCKQSGLVVGKKFCYTHNKNRVLTIQGYETDPKIVQDFDNGLNVILAKDMAEAASMAFHYSEKELLTSSSIELLS